MTELPDLFRGDTLVPGALRGYRRWKSLTDNSRLVSTGMQYAWPESGHDTAVCRKFAFNVNDEYINTPMHDAPKFECECGIYGWYKPNDGRIPLMGASGAIFGAIEATGKIILGSHGFRAEKVRVLGVTGLHMELPYPTFDSIEELVEAFPPQDVSELVDHKCDGECIESVKQWQSGLVSAPVYRCNCSMCQGVMPPSPPRVVSPSLGQWSSPTQNTWVWSSRSVTWSGANTLAPLIITPEDPDPGPKTAKEAALEARRNRNTGPPRMTKGLRDALKNLPKK